MLRFVHGDLQREDARSPEPHGDGEALYPQAVEATPLTPLIREGSSKDRIITVENLSIQPVTSASSALSLVNDGLSNRRVGVTNLNIRSSRSHAVFTLTLTCEVPPDPPFSLGSRRLHHRHAQVPVPPHRPRWQRAPDPGGHRGNGPPRGLLYQRITVRAGKRHARAHAAGNSRAVPRFHAHPPPSRRNRGNVSSRTPSGETPSPRLLPPCRPQRLPRGKRSPRCVSPPTPK